MINKILNNIIEIKINNVLIEKQNLEIKRINDKYHLFLKNQKVYKYSNNKFEIKFKCIKCGVITTFKAYRLFINKITQMIDTNNQLGCLHCYQKYKIQQNKKRSLLYKNKSKKQKKGIINQNRYIIKTFNDKFAELTKDQKQQYINKQMTNYQWNEFKKHLVSFNKISDIQNLQYEMIGGTYKRIYPIVTYKNKHIRVKDMYVKCESCGKIYKLKNQLSYYKNKKEYFCRDCSTKYHLCNHKFHIKHYKNVFKNDVLYLSQYQKEFIDFCNKNNIQIINGPSIDYYWNDGNHKYHVDFYLPKFKWLVQLKDMHIWHKRQLQNGKWEAKYNSAIKLIKQQSDKFNEFFLIYKSNFQQFKNKILNQIKIQSDL